MSHHRPRLRRLIAAPAALAATGVLVAACGSSPGGPGSSSGSAKVSNTPTVAAAAPASSPAGVALNVGDQAGTGAQSLLEASGLLKKLPFTVHFDDFTSGPPMLQAMSGGSIDIGGVGDAPPVFAASGGEKLAVVGALQNNPANAALVVPGNSSITSIKDLKGKRIAVAQGSSADYHLLTVLKKAGLSIHDVTLDYLQPADALSALASGSVDAWDTWSPYIEQAVVQKGDRVLVDGSGYGSNYSYEVASTAALKDPKKVAAIDAYLKILNQAHRWADTHQSAWGAVWAKATDLPTPVMDKAASDATQTPVAVTPTIVSQEQSLVDGFYGAGLIPRQYSFGTYSSSAFNGTVR